MLDVYKGNYENFHRTREERLKNQQKEYDAQKQYRDHIQVLIVIVNCFKSCSRNNIRIYNECEDGIIKTHSLGSLFGICQTVIPKDGFFLLLIIYLLEVLYKLRCVII